MKKIKKVIWIWVVCFFNIFFADKVEAVANEYEFRAIGQFVTGDDNNEFLYPEKADNLTDQFKDAYIYKFRIISDSEGYAPEKYIFYSKTERYICVCMEKSYFEENLNYEQAFLIRLTGTDLTVSIKTKSGNYNMPVLTPYNSEKKQYINPINTDWVDWNNEKNAVLLRGTGYFEEKVSEYDFLNPYIDKPCVYKFRLVSSPENDEEFCYVVCGEKFYENNKDKGVEILFASSYGTTYENQPLWFLFTMETGDYSFVRTWNLDEMKSWYTETASDDNEMGTGDSTDKYFTGMNINMMVIITLVMFVIIILGICIKKYCNNHKNSSGH